MGGKAVHGNQVLTTVVPPDTLFLGSLYGATQKSVS